MCRGQARPAANPKSTEPLCPRHQRLTACKGSGYNGLAILEWAILPAAPAPSKLVGPDPKGTSGPTAIPINEMPRQGEGGARLVRFGANPMHQPSSIDLAARRAIGASRYRPRSMVRT